MVSIVFQLTTPLNESSPEREFMHVITGDIRHDDSDATIGYVTAFLIQVGRVADAGQDLGEIMDAESSELSECHSTFFKPHQCDYKDSIRRQFVDICPSDLLILDRLEIQPAFQKRGIGLLAVSKTIDTFGESCGLVAMKPFPLQFRSYRDPAWSPPADVVDPQAAFRAAREKLRKYWSRAGFKRVNGTDYWALCPALKRPSLRRIAEDLDV